MHGLTRNGRDFDFLAQALAADYRVICPDMPGRGQSDWLADASGYNYPAYVAAISFILKSLNLTQIDWVGTSMGGIIGMMLANAQPGIIRKLALNDIGCIISGAGMKRILSYSNPLPLEGRVREGVPQGKAFPCGYPPPSLPLKGGGDCLNRAQAEAVLRERCAPFGIREEAHWQQLFRYGIYEKNGCHFPTYDPAIMAMYSKDRDKKAAIADVDLWGLWEALTKLPILLIRGEESDLLTRDTALQMQARHPSLTLREIPNCGHAPALMEDNQITMVKEWLNRHS